MPFCGSCGKQYDDNRKFCPFCGTPNDLFKTEVPDQTNQDPGFQTVKRDTGPYGAYRLEDLPEGFVIDDRYEIKAKVGQGGFGAVYRAYDRNMDVDKALKIIPDSVAADKEAMADLQKEARIMISLNNPNIVRVYDFRDSGLIKYIDMEYVEGKPLNELKLDYPDKRMPEDRVKDLGSKIAAGLEFAHEKNIIHKDIKPQNIIVTESGDVKITDFGISESVRTSMSRLSNSSSSGTLVYMSPEQLKGERIGKEADIYSFGATLYELLSGHPPFYQGAVEYQIMNEAAKPIEGVSDDMNAMVLKCLEKDYRKRFKNLHDVTGFYGGTSAVPTFYRDEIDTKNHLEIRNRVERIQKLNPASNTLLVELEFLIGKIVKSGGTGEAIEKLEYLFDEEPGNVILLSALALLHREIGEIEEEYNILKTLIANERKGVEIPRVLGLLKERWKAMAELRNGISKSTENERKNIQTLLNRAEKENLLDPKEIDAHRKRIHELLLSNNGLLNYRDMVMVEGGTFQMGSNSGHNNEKPVHSITISSFFICKYAVTQGLWKEVMGNNPSNSRCGIGESNPVNSVSWYDAVRFCNKISEKDGLEPVYQLNGKNVICDWNKNGYRLPTEAEWEYSARGGNKRSRGYMYAGSNSISDVAWYKSNSGSKTHPVGQKEANELGLYDLSGNVLEWCWDVYRSYENSNQSGSREKFSSGFSHVFRGGSWKCRATHCRVSNRDGFDPLVLNASQGFRLACSAEIKIKEE